jgi:hypothetical protein
MADDQQRIIAKAREYMRARRGKTIRHEDIRNAERELGLTFKVK